MKFTIDIEFAARIGFDSDQTIVWFLLKDIYSKLEAKPIGYYNYRKINLDDLAIDLQFSDMSKEKIYSILVGFEKEGLMYLSKGVDCLFFCFEGFDSLITRELTSSEINRIALRTKLSKDEVLDRYRIYREAQASNFNDDLWILFTQTLHGKYISANPLIVLHRESGIVKTNLYVMIDRHTGYSKIGRSEAPLKREKTLLSQAPLIELLFYFGAPLAMEVELHKTFESKRIRGEWFDLMQEDLDYIKKVGGVQ